MNRLLASVAVENVAYHFDILYKYAVPPELESDVVPGVRVMVGFGKGKSERQGVVFFVQTEETAQKCKPILKVLDNQPLVDDDMLSLACFLKERTFCTYFEAVKVQLPVGFNFKMNVTYAAVTVPEDIHLTKAESEIYDYMLSFGAYLKKQDIIDGTQTEKAEEILSRLVAKGAVVKNYEASKRIGNLSVRYATLTAAERDYDLVYDSLTPKQKSVVSVLKDVGCATVKELCCFAGVSDCVVLTLQKKGVIAIDDRTLYRTPQTTIIDDEASKPLVLTPEQEKAYNELKKIYKSGSGGVSLLYGITGSGKTSVYLKLIDCVISNGQQAIVMVPEISLTPQMMAIFKGRYGSRVAIFHSALSMGERKDEYSRVLLGEVDIVVGTRSAVFAPLKKLGLVVIDEEQEHTYKSEASPRYHTKDVARFRCLKSKALLVLASATPSVETYSMADTGIFSLNKITKRYGGAVLPDVTIIDMKKDRAMGNKYNISLPLQQMIAQNLQEKKQTILLINRRGYNTYAECDACGNVITCPSCSISLTYHIVGDKLMCHYCGHSQPFTSKCPRCGKYRVRYSGFGTQRIEEQVKQLFPRANVLRMDADSNSSRNAFEKNLIDFADGKYDIMLGTQMVAKGLNFENVTLVGVINADQQLNNDDFRSGELTFDLLTQVVGRSGRGKSPGRAAIQTLNPENNIIRLAKQQDYETFFLDEMKIRRTMIYPPFCDICTISAVSENEDLARDASAEFLESLKELAAKEYSNLKMIILPSMPPRVSKINNKYRYRIIIKCKNNKTFRQMISTLLIQFGKAPAYSSGKDAKVSFVADINPYS